MKRTPSLQRRRHDLANASSGFLRPAVVLYACLPYGHDPAPLHGPLRDYAGERGWAVTAEIVDREPLTTPLDGRAGWRRVREYILTREAVGVVTPTPAMCGHQAEERARLTTWLTEHAAFTAIALPPTSPCLTNLP